MGYRAEDGGWLPGITTLSQGRKIASCGSPTRAFRPHDDFCALWHLFDLLPEGSAGWKPKYSYW